MTALTAEETALLLGGAAAFVTAITGVVALLVSLRRGLREVHLLVNSQLTAVVDRVAQLEARFAELGIDIPDVPAGRRDL